MRLTMKALRAASGFCFWRYQKPISRNEHTPTPSQPTNSSGKESAITSTSIAAMNRLSAAK